MRRGKTGSCLLCLLLTLTLCFTACKTNPDGAATTGEQQGGSPGETGQVVTASGNLRLSYSKSDSLNPFFAQSLNNLTLVPLLYESLVTLDTSYTAHNALAASVANSGATLTVRLASGKKFSNGGNVTAADVLYSFQKAKASTAYKGMLASIRSASSSGGAVVFTLSSADPFAQNLLTFPIVKSGSADKADDSPIGSGMYQLKRNSSSLQLVYSQGSKPKFTTIDLVNASATDSIANSLKVGNVSLIFKDLSEGSFSRISSKTVETPLNNLVFVGINSANKLLAQAEIRQAINQAINRTVLTNSAYQGHARVASSPYNPSWAQAKDIVTGPSKPDTDAVAKAMEAAGCTRDAKTRLWKKDGAVVSLRLLVNKENAFRVSAAKLIASQLAEQGIQVTVEEAAYQAYSAAVNNSKFDLYIGEIQLPNNMSLDAFFLGGSAAKGITSATRESTDAYKAYRAGTGDLASFAGVFENDVPFVPICYRNGLTAYTSEMKGEVSPLPGNVFAGIQNWSF